MEQTAIHYSHTPSGSPFGMNLDQVGPLLIAHCCPSPSTDPPTGCPFGITADINNPPSAPFEAQEICPLDAANDCTAPYPIGGHLAHFSRQWELTMTDAWILQKIRLGLTLKFSSNPPNRFV